MTTFEEKIELSNALSRLKKHLKFERELKRYHENGYLSDKEFRKRFLEARARSTEMLTEVDPKLQKKLTRRFIREALENSEWKHLLEGS